MRFALHVLTGRREDRLLFDHQIRLAQMFGYEDATYTLAVEQFMQRYYRTVMDVSLLNEMLLQLFREAILTDTDAARRCRSIARFQIRNDYLEVTARRRVRAQPVGAARAVPLICSRTRDVARRARDDHPRCSSRHLWLIDEEFRQNPRNHRLFLEILRAPAGVTHELRRMNLYGVLGRYIPAFGRIVGRMQYDLFHAYTVDAHTLFVREQPAPAGAAASSTTNCPSCRAIMQPLPKPEIAYLAALFHDIAKGRGGDHSELGAVDAEAFCLEQGLSRYDARLVAWLVRHHLLLSVTAQKKDISDPEGDPRLRAHGRRPDAPRLPVRAHRRRRARHESRSSGTRGRRRCSTISTSARKRALRRGLESAARPGGARARNAGRPRATNCWRAGVPRGTHRARSGSRFNDPYFLRHTPEEVAWHTQLLADREPARHIAARGRAAPRPSAAATPCSTYAPHRQQNFARTTAAARPDRAQHRRRAHHAARGRPQSRHVSRARRHGRADRRPASRAARSSSSCGACCRARRSTLPVVTRRAPRQVRMFSTPTQITFTDDPTRNRARSSS